MRILIIGAHPDDELIGCGGTIVKYLEKGHDVYVLICTKVYYSMEDGWSREYCDNQPIWQRSVDKYLGITKRYNFPYPTVQLNNIPHGDLSNKIKEVIEEVNPDMVFTHFRGDLNLDHVLVSICTQVACRPPRNVKLLSYEVVSNTEHGEAFKPNYYEVLSKNHFIKKLKAYKFYEVESKVHTRTVAKLERHAKKRADEILVNYAEAFRVIREVNI